MDDYILIVGGDVSMRERSFAGALRAAGGRPVFTVTTDRESPGLRFFDGALFADIGDHESIIREAERLVRETGARPAAVVPTNDFSVDATAKVAEHFDLLRNSARTVELCRDKYAMKCAFAEAGIPVPRFRGFSTWDEVEDFIGEFTFPVVLKPRQMAGSLGVVKVDRLADLKSAYAQSIEDVLAFNGQSFYPDDVFQLEEYIDYEFEVSVEVMHYRGSRFVLAVTDKQLGAEPYFVELGHVVPSVHSDNPALVDCALRACEVLGIEYGMAHFEAKVSRTGEVKVIEVAARTGGDSIMDLIAEVYGVNPYEMHVSSYLGADGHPVERAARGVSAIAFLKAPAGTVTKVDRTSKLLSAPDVRAYSVTAKPGDVIKPLTSWLNREGFVRFHWPADSAAARAEPPTKNLFRAREISSEIFYMAS